MNLNVVFNKLPTLAVLASTFIKVIYSWSSLSKELMEHKDEVIKVEVIDGYKVEVINEAFNP